MFCIILSKNPLVRLSGFRSRSKFKHIKLTLISILIRPFNFSSLHLKILYLNILILFCYQGAVIVTKHFANVRLDIKEFYVKKNARKEHGDLDARRSVTVMVKHATI